MEIELLKYWYLFPISIIIATTAMATGIGGAVFFSPIFMLALKLDPVTAVGTALITELFGFSSGLFAYFKRRLIDFKLGLHLLMFSIPASVIGVYYAEAIPAPILKTIFSLGIIVIGYQLFISWKHEQKSELDDEVNKEDKNIHESKITDSAGKVYHYTICNRNEGRLFAVIGGAFVGMISVGLAELQEYLLVARCRVPTPVAVATSVFMVVVTVLVASVGHMYSFYQSADSNILNQIVSIVIYTIPGVLIGGQFGPLLQSRLNPDKVKVAVSLLFISTGVFMLFSLMHT